MKALWITNIIFLDVFNEIEISTPAIRRRIHSSTKMLIKENTTYVNLQR